MTPGAGREHDRWARLALLAPIALLFASALFRGHVFYERDVHQMYWGQAETFVRTVLGGSLPLWDPSTGFGQPMLANPGAEILYPWTWLNLLVDPQHFYTFFVCSHVYLSGLGFYAFGRRLGLSPAAGLAGALVWTTSGPFLSMTSLWHHLASAAWIPWVLLLVHSLLAGPTLARATRLAFVLAIQVLAGSADMVVITAGLAAALGLWQTRGHLRASIVGLGGAAVTAAAGLTAVLWMPALQAAGASARAGLAPGLRSFWSVHPFLLLQTVAPAFLDRLPLSTEARALLFESREPFFSSLYLGVAALPLVFAAFLGPARRLALVLAATGSLAALLALGRFGVVYPALTTLLPPLQSLRYPVKAMVAAAFVWALLAGLGLDALRRPRERDRGARIVLGGAAIAVMLLAGAALAVGCNPATVGPWLLAADTKATAEALGAMAIGLATAAAFLAGVSALIATRSRAGLGRTATIAALGLVAGDLLVAHRALSPTAPAALFAAPPPVVGVLRADGATRVYAFDYFVKLLGKQYRRSDPAIPAAAGGPLPQALRTALARQAFLSPPAAARFDLAGSFDFDWLGLQPGPIRNLGLYLRGQEETPAFARLLRIGAVSHVVALHREGLEDLSRLATLDDLYAGAVHVLRVPGSLPRVYAVDGVRIADGLAALQALADPGFDPEREIVLPEGSAISPRSPGRSATPSIEAWAPDRVRLTLDANGPTYVVLVEAYDPGWRADLDGVATPVLRANVAFRASLVPAGHHTLEFVYRPRALIVGGAVSVASLVLVGLCGTMAGRKRPPPRV